MIAEVNKLILNILITRGSVLLPEIGTLYVKRTPAKIISRSSVAVSYLEIAFSTHLEALSLVDAIVSTANIDVSQAKDIYQRWLDKVRSGNRVTIDCIGVLNDKSFIVDNQLNKLLNPQDYADIAITRNYKGVNGKVAAIIFVLLLCAAGAGYYLYDRCGGVSGVVASTDDDAELSNIPPRVVTTPASDIKEDDGATAADDFSLQDGSIVAEQVATTAEKKDAETQISTQVENIGNDWREIDGIRHYVVVGSYSTEENAARAISTLDERFESHCFSYFRLGSMYAVAAYGSVKREDCETFKREYNDDFKQSWIYTPRKYRE